MFLSEDELRELTGRCRRDAQARALRFMGIEHKIRPDGSLALLRTHVEQVLSGGAATTVKKDIQPNWEAI